MNTKNLWGDLPAVEESRLPITILKEQAALLGQATNKILLAQVKTRNVEQIVVKPSKSAIVNLPTLSVPGTESVLAHTLSIIAPALDNYAYGILEVHQSLVPIYPLTVVSLIAGFRAKPVICESESQYLAALEGILSSHQVRNIISALLLQSRAAA